MRYYREDILKERLKNELDRDAYETVIDILKKIASEEVIPIEYVKKFVENRDPVYKSNIKRLLNSYKESLNADRSV